MKVEQRKIRELYIKVKDSKNEEAWVSMIDFSRAFIETIGETINLTFKKIGKEIEKKTDEGEDEKDT